MKYAGTLTRDGDNEPNKDESCGIEVNAVTANKTQLFLVLFIPTHIFSVNGICKKPGSHYAVARLGLIKCRCITRKTENRDESSQYKDMVFSRLDKLVNFHVTYIKLTYRSTRDKS